MLIRPIFKPHFRQEFIGEESVVLLSEQGHFALEGKLYIRLAPLLDGKHTVDDIVDACADDIPAAQVYYAISTMEKKGYIIEAVDDLPIEQAAFWSALGADPAAAAACLRQTTVSVAAYGAVDTTPLLEVLSALGIGTGPDGTVGVVVTDDPLRPELTAYNREALAAGRPWLLIKPDGFRPWIGPLFRPGVNRLRRLSGSALPR